MRRSNISKVYIGAPRAYRSIDCNERAHAHAKRARTRTNVHKDMPRMTWGRWGHYKLIYYH